MDNGDDTIPAAIATLQQHRLLSSSPALYPTVRLSLKVNLAKSPHVLNGKVAPYPVHNESF